VGLGDRRRDREAEPDPSRVARARRVAAVEALEGMGQLIVGEALWGWLDKYKADPSKPIKSAIGLMFAGLSFIPLAIAAQQAGATGGQVSVWWLVLAYFILEISEMCLSPPGLRKLISPSTRPPCCTEKKSAEEKS